MVIIRFVFTHAVLDGPAVGHRQQPEKVILTDSIPSAQKRGNATKS